MGTFSVEMWKCDRCEKIENQRPAVSGGARYQLFGDADYGTTGQQMIEWRELCNECNSYVGSVLHELAQKEKKQEHANADY